MSSRFFNMSMFAPFNRRPLLLRLYSIMYP